MRFRVKDYCRIILYLPSEEKLKASYAPQKPKRIEDDVDMRLSEDETPIEVEDAHTPSSNHRPPSYNPEDYAHALAKYSSAPNLYIHDPKDKKGRGKEKEKSSNKETQAEMSLKQFASLPELLRRLREDLKTAYISFVKELVRDPHDGVALLIDLLKMIQLAQSNLSGISTNREQQIALRRTLIDEFECLSCLRCCLRCSESAPRLANQRNGLYPLAAATMSSLTRSRTIALQLLTKACEHSVCGHRQVVEAFSTLRLRFAEPVRCKFLVSMMLSYPHPSFQVWGLKLVNALLSSAVSLKERIYLQEELGEAGFDASAIRKALEHRGAATLEQQEAVRNELDKWIEGYIDIAALEDQLSTLKSANASLKQELQQLRQSNMKLLEENVLVKAVGGEVEVRCSALERRLEKHGLPSAPSPTPSVTDSEMSSFVNTGRSTVKRNVLESPNTTMERSPGGTMDTSCHAEGEKSTSLEWQKALPNQERRSRKLNGLHPPVPKKRSLLMFPEHANRSLYVNDICGSEFDNNSMNDKIMHVNHTGTEVTYDRPQTGKVSKETSRSIDLVSDVSSSKSSDSQGKSNSSTTQDEEEPIYQSPVKPSRPKSRKKAPRLKSGRHSIGENEDGENSNGGEELNKSLSSSVSSLSVSPSTVSLDGVDRKDEHQYENLPKKTNTVGSCTNSLDDNILNNNIHPIDNENGNKQSNSNKSELNCKKNFSRLGCEDGEMEYERDVQVYEAITLGTDTILLDKNSNTNSSTSSDKSKGSNKSIKNPDLPGDNTNVRQSVRKYENFVNRRDKGEIKAKVDNKNDRNGEKSESKSILNGLMNGLKKKKTKTDKKEKQNIEDVEGEWGKCDNTVVGDIEPITNGYGNKLGVESSANISSSRQSRDDTDNFEDRASPEHPLNEIEIVSSRMPPVPLRTRSRGTSSHSSRSHTPDAVVYLESPSETSDTDTFNDFRRRSPNFNNVENASPRSFGYNRENVGIRRRDTFAERIPEKANHRRQRLRRSESVHVNNLSEYNSHRSYSPRRRGSMEMLVPLEESEIQISGRRFMQYTAAEIEQRNRFNDIISSGKKRRRNRSCDDRLDRWLHEDCMQQSSYSCEFLDDFPPQQHQRSHRSSPRILNDDRILSSRSRNSPDARNSSPLKPSRSSKSRAPPEHTGFSGFGNPNQNLRECALRSNFILNNSPTPRQLEDALIDIVDLRDSKNFHKIHNGGFQRKQMLENPAIPTPDYSATPAGTLTNGHPSGRHILDMASGLY